MCTLSLAGWDRLLSQLLLAQPRGVGRWLATIARAGDGEVAIDRRSRERLFPRGKSRDTHRIHVQSVHQYRTGSTVLTQCQDCRYLQTKRLRRLVPMCTLTESARRRTLPSNTSALFKTLGGRTRPADRGPGGVGRRRGPRANVLSRRGLCGGEAEPARKLAEAAEPAAAAAAAAAAALRPRAPAECAGAAATHATAHAAVAGTIAACADDDETAISPALPILALHAVSAPLAEKPRHGAAFAGAGDALLPAHCTVCRNEGVAARRASCIAPDTHLHPLREQRREAPPSAADAVADDRPHGRRGRP